MQNPNHVVPEQERLRLHRGLYCAARFSARGESRKNGIGEPWAESVGLFHEDDLGFDFLLLMAGDNELCGCGGLFGLRLIGNCLYAAEHGSDDEGASKAS